METPERSQARRSHGWEKRGGVGSDLIVPNPKLKLLDQVREVMRLKHYSIRTERCYCDWIRRYIHFHRMRSRDDLQGAEPKIELFLRKEQRTDSRCSPRGSFRPCGSIWPACD